MDNIKINRLPELLAPAGDFEKLRFALAYGADAVYFGGKEFGLRAKSNNFTIEEIAEAVDYCHQRGKKAYITVNIFAHNDDIRKMPVYLEALNKIGPDGLLISDPGVFLLAKEYAPDIPVHISTQANNVNSKTVEFWTKLGAERVVLGRELSLAEIKEIKAQTDTELEMFVHGAMCMSYSGRCLLSNYLTGRDANQGACTHPCRWKYHLVEEQRPGEYFPIEEDSRGSYIMNSKDLNLLAYLPQLVNSGVDSLKIEGRIKSIYYIAVVVSVYRRALDCMLNHPDEFEAELPGWERQLQSVSHREYSHGFMEGKPQSCDYRYFSSSYNRSCEFVAIVKDYDSINQRLVLEQRNYFKLNEKLQFYTPDGEIIDFIPEDITDTDGNSIDKVPHAQMLVSVPWTGNPLPRMSILRRPLDKCDE